MFQIKNNKLNKKMYSKKTVLVTGAGGFIGQNLLKLLLVSGAEVSIVLRSNVSIPAVKRKYIGSIADKQFMNSVIKDCNPQIIFHLAGSRNRELDRSAFDNSIEVNLMGTLNVLFGSIKIPELERVIVLGSGEEYGSNASPFLETMRELPISAYSFSKQCSTHLAQLMHNAFDVPVVIIRPSLVYGPFQQTDMFLPSLIQCLLRGEVFRMSPGEQTRDYIYVMDLIEALLSAGISPNVSGEIINIGSGEAVKIIDLVDRVESMLGVAKQVQRGAIDYRISEPMDYFFDINRAHQLLDWFPRTSLSEGLLNTINHFKSKLMNN
jgi:UDP-glucose 4-epimerase